MRGALLLAVALLASSRAAADGPKRVRVEHDDVVITEDSVLEPGTWHVRDEDGDGVIHVRADGVTLDLGGACLDGAAEGAEPDAFAGTGITVAGAKGVTVKNGLLRGFKVGLRAERASGLRVQGLDASGNFKQRLKSTPEREDASDWLWPHHNDQGEWERNYGAGLSLNDCEDAEVAGCTVTRGQNGLLLTRCTGCRVTGNDLSFNSGWGLALYRSNRCRVASNRCDFCVRGYSHGVYARGQDSAGILVFEQCSNNEIVGNSATHSGDGLFLYAGHETTQRTGKGGSNHNRVRGNDFRFAVANAIEATFSRDNSFVENDGSGSDYGVWAGYSRNTLIRGNVLDDCLTAGVAIEHGQENVILLNTIRRSRGHGVHLWWDDDRDLLASPYCREGECTSARNEVLENRIWGSAREAVKLDGDVGSRVEGNRTEPVRALPDAPSVPGREAIRVDEWGPVDPGTTVLFPRRVTAGGGSARVHLLGTKPFRVVGVGPGVRVEPREGTAPAVLVVSGEGPGPSLRAFRFEVESDGRHLAAEGTLLVAEWDVRWFPWRKDPREDASAFEALVAGEPAARARLPSLDLSWQTGGPEGVAADRFATVAETTLSLPAGRYRLRTVSDDGVRVKVGGKTVLENWTWHGPTEDAADLDLPAGDHAVRVEHFEIDGWAEFRFALELVTDHR